MMGAWVTCLRVPPPVGRTIMVRFGASVIDAALTRFNGWVAVLPGGTEEKIEAPQLWWCQDAEAALSEAEEQRAIVASQPRIRSSKEPKQLALAFDDSISQSHFRKVSS